MNIEIKPLHPPISFEDFADRYGLLVTERSQPGIPRWSARFEGCSVSEPCVLIGVGGDGDTPEDAIENYKHKIAGKKLAFGQRRETRVQCPREWSEPC